MASQGLARHLFEVEKRRGERDEVFYRTVVRLAGSPEIACEIINISRFGFMARTAGVIAQETVLEIRLPGRGWQPGRVAWQLGPRIGAEFKLAIDPVDYRALLDALAGRKAA